MKISHKIVVVMIVGPCGAHCLIPHCMEKLPAAATFPCNGDTNGAQRDTNEDTNGASTILRTRRNFQTERY